MAKYREGDVQGLVVRQIVGLFVGCAILLLASWASAQVQDAPCYAGFEISEACIAQRGLDQKVDLYQRKIMEAMPRLGASYKITLRIVNIPLEGGYTDVDADVFTDVVRNKEMRNESFIINVTTDFLEKQPEILFEASSLHEVCHIMNDDLTGYHRNGANSEVAEERCVLEAVGESRYTEYLQAYSTYRHWDSLRFAAFLQRVKEVTLVPPPSEIDEADKMAADYFRKHADGKEHLLVYNGELRDVSLQSTKNTVRHDPEKLNAVIRAGKPMIFFHNHPAEYGKSAMFPSTEDFGVAGLFSFIVYKEDPNLSVEFRVVHIDEESTIVSYGFKGTTLDDIRKAARIETMPALLVDRLEQDSFNAYLQYACPVDLTRSDAEVCKTHPQYFIWPSDSFFIHFRP